LLLQNSTRVFGMYAYLHPACRCQKHPCTKMVRLCRGKVMSGRPGRSRRCRRNRKPARCKDRLTANSGEVSR
jgi:hypothetical protein